VPLIAALVSHQDGWDGILLAALVAHQDGWDGILIALLVAHQGGWDEILLVVGPILLIIGVLAVAKRRVDRLDHGSDDDP
jgi:hypothetical protein